MNQNDISSLLLDAYDLKRAIPKNIQNRAKDNDGTDCTIGDLLDCLIETLERHEVVQQ
jgi:hypothetical protein